MTELTRDCENTRMIHFLVDISELQLTFAIGNECYWER